MSEKLVSVEQAQNFVDAWNDPELRRFAEEYAADQTLGFAQLAIAQAEQVRKVRDTRSMINQLIMYSGGAIAMTPEDLAKSIVNKLNDDLGDTDD